MALITFLSAIALTACGAEVNTQLNLHEDYSGQRQFVLTMADSDSEVLAGGVDAAAQALERHAPEVLVFDGIESEAEGYSATFTVDFEDADDYRNKLTTLLDASDVPEAERGMTIDIDEQQLVTSIVFEEDFYNDDLMGWASDALIEEEIVPGNTTVLTTGGAASVNFDGEEVSTSTSLPRINFSLTDDRRFEDIDMAIEILDSGDLDLALSYAVSPDSTATHNHYITQRVDELNALEGVEGAVEDSGAVENHDSGTTDPRTVSATFTSAEAVEAGMKLLLANDQATFEINDITNDASPEVMTEYVGSTWNCDAICNPDNLQQLEGETLYPEHWQLVDQRRGNGEFYVQFNRGMPLHSLTSTTQLDFDGSMHQTFQFVVAAATQQGHEETIAQMFTPPESGGSLHTTTRDNNTIYTTSFEAQNADELVEHINTYLADKGITDTVTIDLAPVTGIWPEYDLNVDLSAVWELATGGVEETATFQVALPTMHTAHNALASDSDGTIIIDVSTGNFSITASGPTMTTVWVAIATVLLLGVILALVIWRKQSLVASLATTGSANSKPYIVQGPKDDLTETEIFRSSWVPDSQNIPASEASNRPAISDPEDTRIYDYTQPFPDLAVPSSTKYQDFLLQPETEPDSEDPPANPETSTTDQTICDAKFGEDTPDHKDDKS